VFFVFFVFLLHRYSMLWFYHRYSLCSFYRGFYYVIYHRYSLRSFYQKNTMMMVRRSIPTIDTMARRRLCESEDRDKR